tara:strand:+ start:5377 stop:6486 length:1110 start_codon:yes stop_codon:yes gene_type:complete
MTPALNSEEAYKNVLRGLWNNRSGTYEEWETLIKELPHYGMTEEKARALEPDVKESLGVVVPWSIFDKPGFETSKEKIAKRFLFFSLSFCFFLVMLWIYQRVEPKETQAMHPVFAESSLKVEKQRSNKTFLPFDKMVEIKGGNFLMGSSDGDFDEEPIHRVHLLPFQLAGYEVTYSQFQEFIKENPHWEKGKPGMNEVDLNYLKDWNGTDFPKGRENFPVVYVSWFAASAYAYWFGRRLPTESEWEYAARGGLRGMPYPWGKVSEFWIANIKTEGLINMPKPVGNYSMNGFRIFDMAGNVREWTADGYSLYNPAEQRNPQMTTNQRYKVVRGGSWETFGRDSRVSKRWRERPNHCGPDIGFRVATDIYS